MSATAGVVTFGETMALFISPEAGPMRHATTLRVSTGGSESNVAIGVRRLGFEAAWMGRVGDDEFGRKILGALRAEQVDVDAATVDARAPTGLMFKSHRTGSALRVQYYRKGSAAAQLTPAHLDEQRIRGAALIHVTGITAALSDSARATVFAAVEIAREAGTTISFDPNYRAALWPADEAARCFADLAKRADIVLAGEEEARMMCGDAPASRLAAMLGDAGPSQAIVKLGDRGAVGVIEGEQLTIDAVPVEVVDPVGAGDAFAAGYLCGVLDGRPPAGRLRLAGLVGAFAVTVRSDWEGLPTPDELGLLDTGAADVHR